MRHFRLYLLLIVLVGSLAHFASAEDFSSTNFTINDPVVAEPASYGTSSNYGLWGVIPNIAPTAGSSTGFGLNPGFLAYANITMPELSATATKDTLSLEWTAAAGTVAPTYEPGYATTMGGPYTFSSAQVTRAAILADLSVSTAYYVIVRVREQSGGALLGYSNELAISTLAAPNSPRSAAPGASSTITTTVWVVGPTGLTPVVNVGGSTSTPPGAGVVLQPGESVTVAPPLFRQFGYVVILDGELEVPVKGATVQLLRLNPETNLFEVWPDATSSVVLTDAFGLYSFLIPPGTYRLMISADGYLDYAGPAIVVDSTGKLDQRVELVKKMAVDTPWYWLVALSLAGLAILILVVYLMFRFIFRR